MVVLSVLPRQSIFLLLYVNLRLRPLAFLDAVAGAPLACPFGLLAGGIYSSFTRPPSPAGYNFSAGGVLVSDFNPALFRGYGRPDPPVGDGDLLYEGGWPAPQAGRTGGALTLSSKFTSTSVEGGRAGFPPLLATM